jgi:hypothetical protein
MNRHKHQFQTALLAVGVLIVLVGSAFSISPMPNTPARGDAPPGPDRYATLITDYTIYYWWMARFMDGSLVCEIVTDHDGEPTLDDVYIDCGEDIYDDWLAQDPCLSYKTELCEGFYLYLVESEPAQREIAVSLPPATAWVALEDCTSLSSASTNLCEYIPKLVLSGHEPLPNEEITGIAGLIDGEPFSCDSPCHIRLAPTGESGATVEFWAFSSYGDSSETYSAQVRVAESNLGDPDKNYWYVDVLSSQWTGTPLASCADSWKSFPPVGGPPPWLTTPKRAEDLTTDVPYTYLAASLIQAGAVDASSCENDGLLPDSYGANTCGLQIAQPAVRDWQNRFDNLILDVAHDTGVPAQMLKNLFAQESQFWPALFVDSDIGLGQLTENGADTTLLWNPSFYYQFCPLVLPSDRCNKSYLYLDEEEQAILRLGLLNFVNASCTDCPLGIDLTRADFSVSVFGHTLLANCEQAGRIVRNVTGEAPGEAASYEDLWKFTLVNYHAGPGCLGDAVQITAELDQSIAWENVAGNLIGVCESAVDYVKDISK